MSYENQESTHQECDVLVLNKRQASLVVSVLLFIVFIVFIVGYFWGKKQAYEQFSTQISQDSFADQIYYASLYASSGNNQESTTPDSSGEPEGDVVVNSTEEATENVAQPQIPQKSYYAQLIGFGTKPAAKKCAERLQNQGFDVLVKERSSRTKKGNVTHWYQVITRQFTDRESLEKLVEEIKHLEKIKEVRIVTV